MKHKLKFNNYLFKIIPIISFFAIIILLISCAQFERYLDFSGLDDYSKSVLSGNPGNSRELEEFIKKFSLSKSTEPFALSDSFVSEPLDRFILDNDSLKMEKISFPSKIMNGAKQGRAYFYCYSRGSFKNKKIMLWVPGMGVSDFAFRFINKIFISAVSRDYVLAMYVPPFHLDRIETGKSRGDGFISGNPLQDIKIVLECVREIRTIADFFKEKGASSFAGWGGSMGASMLLLASQFIPLENLSIMIPVVDWSALSVGNERMKKAVGFLENSGYSENLLIKAYSLISPSNYKLPLNPEHIMIQYAENDMINRKEIIKNFAEKNGIKNLKLYPRSHATILIDSEVYRDYDSFLDLSSE